MQVLPGILLATGQLAQLRSNWTLAVALLVIALPPVAEEVWVNSITSQFHMMVSAALVLMMKPRQDRIRFLRFAVLIVAPLTGPGGVIAAPLVVLRAIVDRCWRRVGQAAVISIAAMIQAAINLTHPEPARAYQASIPLLICIIYTKHVVLPLFGNWRAEPLAAAVRKTVEHGHWPIDALAGASLALGCLAIGAWKSQYQELRWSFLTGLVFAVASYSAAVTNRPTDLLYYWIGNRDYFAPAVLFSLTILGLACGHTGLIAKLASVLIAWMLLVGGVSYFHVLPFAAHGPNWQQGVADWRAAPKHALHVWGAGPDWVLSISEGRR